MGDRCYLEITLRTKDLRRFNEVTGLGDDWWDQELDAPAGGLIRVAVHEANYALYSERETAAKAGIPFMGAHGEGGDYAGFTFASIRGAQRESEVNRDGELVLAVDRALKPLNGTRHIRSYLRKVRAVEKLFGLEEDDG